MITNNGVNSSNWNAMGQQWKNIYLKSQEVQLLVLQKDKTLELAKHRFPATQRSLLGGMTTRVRIDFTARMGKVGIMMSHRPQITEIISMICCRQMATGHYRLGVSTIVAECCQCMKDRLPA